MCNVSVYIEYAGDFDFIVLFYSLKNQWFVVFFCNIIIFFSSRGYIDTIWMENLASALFFVNGLCVQLWEEKEQW